MAMYHIWCIRVNTKSFKVDQMVRFMLSNQKEPISISYLINDFIRNYFKIFYIQLLAQKGINSKNNEFIKSSAKMLNI